MELTQTQIKNGWRVVKLGEVVDLQQGLAINIKSKYLLVEKSNLALLRITDLINKKEVQYVDEKLVPSQFIAENNSLIYSRTGQVGLVFRNRKGVVHNNCFKIIPHDQIKKDFLYYILQQESFYKSVNQIAQKAAQPDLTHTAFKSLEILLPKVESQEKIAEILSAYDDLIENNEKRIKILEQMAQKLYTEWFVKFKFPGHEFVAMVESGNPDFGMVPNGWMIRKLKDFAHLTMGQSPTSKNYNIEKIGTPFHQGVADFGDISPIDRVWSTAGNKYAKIGDLLFSVRAPVGKMNIADKKIILGRGLSAIHHIENLQSLLCIAFMNKFTTKDMIGNGAIYKSVNKDELENILFISGSKEIEVQFEKIVKNFIDQICHLSKQNQNLKKSRDLLIPQLVGGKLILK